VAESGQPSYSHRFPCAGIQSIISDARFVEYGGRKLSFTFDQRKLPTVCSGNIRELQRAATTRSCDGPIHSEEFRAAVHQLSWFSDTFGQSHGKLSEFSDAGKHQQ
jgi:hypothetical protein